MFSLKSIKNHNRVLLQIRDNNFRQNGDIALRRATRPSFLSMVYIFREAKKLLLRCRISQVSHVLRKIFIKDLRGARMLQQIFHPFPHSFLRSKSLEKLVNIYKLPILNKISFNCYNLEVSS